jgi:UDP-MurNAc hydroxylase
MKIEFYGHNCFVIDTGTATILTDPWFYPAFYTWYPFPINRRLETELLSNQSRFDYLYVSHPHFDHFDAEFLSKLRKDVKVLCPDFIDKTMQREFRRLGFENLIEEPAGELGGGLRFKILLDETSFKEDSALLLEQKTERGAVTFFNLNDCHIDHDRLPRGVTYLAAQFSGAIYYPHAYDFPEEVKARKVKEHRQLTVKRSFELVDYVKPSYFIPSAGPVRFLDPTLAEMNDPARSIFYDFDVVRADYEAMTDVPLLDMQPGDRFADGRLVSGSRDEDRDLALWSGRLEHEWSWFDRDSQSFELSDLSAHFETIRRDNPEFVAAFPRRFRLDIAGASGQASYLVALEPSSQPALRTFDRSSGPPPNYRITLPPQLIRKILYHGWTWSDAFASFKAKLHRDEDFYDTQLFQLLFWGPQPKVLRRIFDKLYADTQMIERNGFRFQRFCPHSGQDLTIASIKGTVLTCPRHGWQWDLKTGACVRGGRIPIKVVG